MLNVKVLAIVLVLVPWINCQRAYLRVPQEQAGQQFPARPFSGPPIPARPFPGPPIPARPFPGQPIPARPFPGQPIPASPFPGQAIPPQPFPNQQQQNSQPQGYLPEKKAHVEYRNDVIKDFEYVPTVQGYRYSYFLYDGSSRTENVFVKGSPNSLESGLDAKNTDLNAVGVGGRRRMPTKNRKLSPKSLQSLAG